MKKNIYTYTYIENIKWLQWVINYKRSTLTSSSIFKGWSPMGFPMVSRRQMPRAPFPSERMRMTIRNPRHMDGFWIRMGLLAEKMGWSGKGWADCCGGKKHGKNPERSRSSHGTMIPNMMDFLWISWFPVWPWFVSLGAAGPREVPFVSWQHGAAHWSWFTFSLSTNIKSRYTFHYPPHTHIKYIYI